MASFKANSNQFQHDEGLHFNMMPVNHSHQNYAHIPVQPDMRNAVYEDSAFLPRNLPLRTTLKSQKSSNDMQSLASYPDQYDANDNISEPLVVSSDPRKRHYRFSRFIPRTLLNIFGPIFILAFYLFIVEFYLNKPSVNGVMPNRPIDSQIVFYAWWLINIFILDWAKSGIAGYEAAALMNPSIAPKNARQLMWHTDRAWGSLTGWAKAVITTSRYLFHKATQRKPSEWTGPSALWFHLALSSMLLYIAIPLSGLSLEQESALRNGSRRVEITGVNQTTFDLRSANALAEQIGGSWRRGWTTTPDGASILYAPDGTPEVSDTYFEDSIQGVYQALLKNTSNPVNETITIFSGPQASERAYGRAWGFLATISCTPVHPYTGLKLLNMTSIDQWSYRTITGGKILSNMTRTDGMTALTTGSSQTLGVNYKYVLATNDDIQAVRRDYSDLIVSLPGANKPPYSRVAEVVIWQAYDTRQENFKPGYFPDQTFNDLATHPMVVNATASDNLTYAGFAVSCSTVSEVGHAALSATTNTFSDFVVQPSTPDRGLRVPGLIPQYPGVTTMTSLAFAAMGNIIIGYLHNSTCATSFSTLCSPWSGANAATRGVPILSETIKNFQLPTISPERMTLAMYKLLGQVAITVMGTGPGNWTCCDPGADASPDLGILGLEPANDLVPGIVPYQAVLVFLSLWVAVTVLPQLYPPFFRRRWSEILDGFAMFRLGAEWRDAIHELDGIDLVSPDTARVLDQVPGMIGDMNPSGKGVVGFVGLSRRKLSTSQNKSYTYN
ncbi:unnamed protein product [Clonostachys solani]|uniref:Uncharacterized protein n=1 Tax=Clonostachys solani TaxID=160281 RepID=A0A9P0EMC9_9HYPO|nr:unnamed protein product [Clonostachys solani]